MIFPAAGAAFLPERLPKSARNRVLMLPRERAELTEHFASIPAQIRWLEIGGRLKSEKTTKRIPG